jgi:DNA-directed RNA polymerase subunit RPC12/RpoP
MAGRSVPCSSCGVSLKLRDSSLIGKRVKCPKCGARFVLTKSQPVVAEPDEVPLQLVDPVIPAKPMLGTSARWVPDGPVPVLPAAPTNTNQEYHIDPDLQNFLVADSRPEIAVTPFAIPRLPDDPAAASASVIDRVKGRRRRSPHIPIAASLAVALFCAVCGCLWILNQQSDVSPAASRIKPNVAWQKSLADQTASNDDAKTLSPTSGKSIPIDYLPFTPHVLCHLHPAALWKVDRHTSRRC